jgi:YfiH family protein
MPSAMAAELPRVEAGWDAPPGVHAFTTTRAGGVSAGRYAHNNLATHTGDVAEAVARNRRELLAAMPGCAHVQWLDQVHGTRCIRASRASTVAVPEADAAWTAEPGLGLAIQTADCLPIVIASVEGHAIGAVHAGWRGLADGVIARAVEAIVEGIGAAQLIAWIGPGIGRDAYEVGADVRSALADCAIPDRVMRPRAAAGKWLLDLQALAVEQLARAGVAPVTTEPACTYGDQRFYSYRRDGVTGRMATVVWIANG